jgi:hypothetical protein
VLLFWYQSLVKSYILVTFALVMIVNNNICFLCISLSLIFILAVGNVYHNNSSTNYLSDISNCSDTPNNQKDSHTTSFENEIYLCSINTKSVHLFIVTILQHSSNISFRSHYSCSIWQPPKLV